MTAFFAFLVGLGFVWSIYLIIKHGGFRGAAYGAKITENIATIKAGSPWYDSISSTWGSVEVDLLQDKHGIKKVGISIVRKSPFGFGITPITLDKNEVARLLKYIKEASEKI